MEEHGLNPFCDRYQRAIELIGARWTGAIIRAILAGVSRFSELTAAVPGLSDRMLAERLRELEAEGIVRRDVVPDMPVRVEYHLTDKGRALSGIVGAVANWIEDWDPAPQASPASGADQSLSIAK